MQKKLCIFICLSVGAFAQAPPSEGENRDANLKQYVDLLRKDIKTNKVAIISDLMELTPDQAAKFWPLYNEYDKALTKLLDDRVRLIKSYADNYGSLTDQKAAEIATGVLNMEQGRIELKRQYLTKMGKSLTPKLAVRFLQIESQLEKIVDLQISASLPIVE